MFDKDKIKLGIAPIGWTNDDMPDLGRENTFEQCISEMALAGFADFLVIRPYEEVEKEFKAELEYLAILGADRINVSEQSYSVQGKEELSVFDHKVHFTEEEWEKLCRGLNRLGQVAAKRGLRLCYHHHMGTGVQTISETERLLEHTNPACVYLCYDTGHFAFSGENPVHIQKIS